MALEVGQLVGIGVQVGIVVGGGNLFRGAALQAAGLDRVAGDHMGMLATVMNGLALRDALERNNIKTRIMSAIPMSGVLTIMIAVQLLVLCKAVMCVFLSQERVILFLPPIVRLVCVVSKSMPMSC
jgi:uridylate kinase